MATPDTDTDFVLDPSDPLYQLLNNSHDPKPFDCSLPMDFDFSDPSLSAFVDPNALFIDGKVPVNSNPALHTQDFLNAYPFFSSPTLSSTSASADESNPGLSPSSSSSSTRASPVAPALPRSTADAVSAFFQNIGPFVAPFQSQPPAPQPLPPSPSPPLAHAVQGPQTHVINTLTTGRPKTSHTTIERRYRTNLNARIQSLKAAVPALRILDQNYKNDEYSVDDRGYIDGVKVARKGSKANVLGKAVEYIRVLKRREGRLKREQDGLRTLICGFPGGQNILTEWEIEWFKKFGGPEKDEIDYEGVEEASDDDDGDGEGEDDGDNSERARKKPKLETSKKEKRKIAPAAPVSAAPVGAPSIVASGEKRKRGRPRKIQPNVPPPITPADPVLLSDPCQQNAVVPSTSHTPQPQQYLLAVFALFSFFNSPLTSTSSTSQPVSHHHTHQGSVLSHTPLTSQPALGWTWNDAVQIVHLFASLAVFVSIVIPWIPLPRKANQSRLIQLIPIISLIRPSLIVPTRETSDVPIPGSPDVSDSGSEPDSSSTEYTVRASKEASDPLSAALDSRGAIDEIENLLRALNVSTGWIGMLRGSLGTLQTQGGKETRRERRAWTRLAELIVLSPEKIAMPIRWQVFNNLFNRLGSARTEAASETLVSDVCTFALLSHSLSFTKTRSQNLWARASRMAESFEVSAYQRLVLGSMTVEEAVACLTTFTPASNSSPVALLATNLLRRRLHSHASSLFIYYVSQGEERSPEFPSIEDSKTWDATLSYGRSLGGDIGLLCDTLAQVSQNNWSDLDIDLKVDAANEHIFALLRATVLYGQVFWGRSAKPKVGDKDGEADVVLHLRRVLGSNVFEESREPSMDELSLEDARDRVVDMIVNLQREQRTRVR